MYRIIIPVGTNEERAMQAVNYVTDLVKDGGSITTTDNLAVTILNVFEKFKAVDEGSQVRSDELFDPDSYPDAVMAVYQALETAGIDPEVVRRHGEPVEEIIDYADSTDADAIVIPTRKRSPVGKAVFGSVTQQVILSTDRPVTIV